MVWGPVLSRNVQELCSVTVSTADNGMSKSYIRSTYTICSELYELAEQKLKDESTKRDYPDTRVLVFALWEQFFLFYYDYQRAECMRYKGLGAGPSSLQDYDPLWKESFGAVLPFLEHLLSVIQSDITYEQTLQEVSALQKEYRLGE